MGILLALTVAAPTVGVRSTGQAPCDSAAFAQALKVLRPELSVEVLDASSHLPADGRVATLEWSSPGQAVLRVTGSATPLVRPIADPECKRVVQTAASIVDGLLEELPISPAPSLDLSGGWWSRLSLAGWVGGGILQGPIRWVPAFDLALRLSLGPIELLGSADIGIQSKLPLATADFGPQAGNFDAIPFDFEIALGYGPRLGPGMLSVGMAAGLGCAAVWAPQTAHVFLSQTEFPVEFFAALAAGYTFDLPAHFFIGLRLEERWAPHQTNVTVEGSNDQVETRRWAFTSMAIAGYHIF